MFTSSFLMLLPRAEQFGSAAGSGLGGWREAGSPLSVLWRGVQFPFLQSAQIRPIRGISTQGSGIKPPSHLRNPGGEGGKLAEEEDPSFPVCSCKLALLEKGCGAGCAGSRSQKWRFSDFHLLIETELPLFSKSNSAPAELADHL